MTKTLILFVNLFNSKSRMPATNVNTGTLYPEYCYTLAGSREVYR